MQQSLLVMINIIRGNFKMTADSLEEAAYALSYIIIDRSHLIKHTLQYLADISTEKDLADFP